MASNRNNRGIAAYIAVAAVLILAFVFIFPQITESGKKTQYSDVIKYFDDYKVSSYTLDLGSGELEFTIEGEEKPRQYTVPNVSVFLDDTENYRENYNQKHPDAPLKQDYKKIKDNSWILSVVPTVLMLGLGIALFIFMMKQAGGGGKYSSFGKANIKNQAHNNGKKVTFADVAGADEEKHEMEEIVDFLKNPKKYSEIGARIPKGVLLLGPPGTGKTLLAKAVAGEAGCPFFPISGSDFVEMFVGVGASRVRDLFEQAKKNAPSIIFIDEIDAVGRQRGTGLGGGHDEREQTLNQLLVEMDGFEGNEGVIILAATNRADVLDPALLRPGRFDRQIRVSNPDKRARSQILKVHARNKHFAPDVDFDNIAQRTPGFSGAELANVLNEAALLAVRSGHQMITLSDVDEAIDRVIGGPAKKSRKYTEHERKLVAYHETGHAIIGLTLEDANQVQNVTIVPRGDAGGYNLMTPREETYFSTKKQLLATITGYMGGRTAEEIFFGDVSSGAHNDIEQATRIARMMVTELGMSELGPIKYDSGDNAVFLGRDYSQLSNTHSGQIAFEIDQQVRKIIETAHAQATEIINNNKDKMDIIANALLEHETLNHEQIQSLYNTGKMPETYDGTEEHAESNDDNNNTPEPPKADPEDDLLDEMK